MRLAQVAADEKKAEVELRIKASKEEEETNRREREMRRIKPSEAASQLPAFVEDDVDIYFKTFERIASQNEWPRDKWLSFLVPKLIGKAYKVYATLDSDSSYEVVKSTILKAYSVTPDSYRQQFRNLKKGFDQTFTEFAQELKRLLKKWLDATETNTFNELINLIVLEQFKAKLPFFILRHIEEQREKDVVEAAGLADAHHLLVQSLNSGDSRKNVRSSSDDPFKSYKPRTTYQNPGGDSRFCTYCKKFGHVIQNCRNPGCKVSKESVGDSQLPRKPVLAVYTDSDPDIFDPYKTQGSVSLHDEKNTKYPVTILRDTGAGMSMIQEACVPNIETAYTGEKASAAHFGVRTPCPIAKVYVKSPIYTGTLKVMVTDQPFEIPNIQMLIGNEVKGCAQVIQLPLVVSEPVENMESDNPEVFPVCAVTRSQKKNAPSTQSVPSDNLYNNFIAKSELIKAQECDPSLTIIRHSITDDKLSKTPYFYLNDGVLMRAYRPANLPPLDVWAETHQVVLPGSVREEVIKLAHDGPSGHLGIKKTYSKILTHFFWPGMKKQISNYIKSCHVCQIVGKPNQVIPHAPMNPIPVPTEPFTKVVIDCVGPLPKTKKGNEYLLTIMDPTTRYPEAIPIKNILAKTIVKHLLHFFTTFGLPTEVQSDRGTNFTSHLFEQIVNELNVHHVMSSAYRPQSQGCLERFHQTLKSMLRKFCLESDRDWDENIDWLLFAIRECPQESTGYSPFELLFGRTIRGPLKVLKDKILQPTPVPNITVAKYIVNLRNTLAAVRKIASKNLKSSQENMVQHQKSVTHRSFSVGDKVLVFFPIPGAPLKNKYSGPYVITKKLSPTNYVIQTPDRRKDSQLVHINLLKKYVQRASGDDPPVLAVLNINVREESTIPELAVISDSEKDTEIPPIKANPPNSKVLQDLPRYLNLDSHDEVAALIKEFPSITSDLPGSCNILAHDIKLISPDQKPIKQAPYRLGPYKAEIMNKEVQYLLNNNLAEPSVSPWASPCILVPKPDGTYRFCTDFRKVNSVTIMDSFPLPLVEELIDRVGRAKIITTLDLNKGYWQIPLTERAKCISSFITPQGLFSYKVLSFGLCNAAATFQRVINEVIRGLPGVAAYIDDLVVMADSQEEHLTRLRGLFEHLSQAGLTLNLAKSKFNKGTVTYLGHIVGDGNVRPKGANVDAIVKFPVPQSRRQVMKFLGMSGYYRRFCPNFSTVAEPLTRLTSTKRSFEWTEEAQQAFEHLKVFLSSSPVLRAPDYNKPFSLSVDASGVGVGAVLQQIDQDTGILHPTAYYSARLKPHEASYSTVEKEALALVKALKRFECYLLHHPEIVTIYSDHNPLTFIKQSQMKNQRIMRWALLLQEYNFTIKHVRGVDNILADCLSRCPKEDLHLT